MTLEFVAGDVFYTLSNQEYQLFKVLAADSNLGAYHVRAYAHSRPCPPWPTSPNCRFKSATRPLAPKVSTSQCGWRTSP
ncbi:hypothetical protein [Hymenobacter ruricola]|uniref:Uncharacterized protein n=1 Tax=Hymenobacter ruricola TaxID=2791023 RepID=A0ABS0I2Y5_9BACT|nr:hypothetical protein [Hymenobacter ruricola]MBF9221310.1 hypothetical protein [Hymenobacter ruricola]